MDPTFEQILPYIRPRSGDMGWLGWAVVSLLVALLLGAVLTYIATGWRQRRRTRQAFYRAGLERRLSKKQVRELFDISRRHRMRDPLLLLTSLKVFDQHAGRLAAETAPGSGTMDRLAAIRRRLGFDAPATAQRFYTTRTLGRGQRLMVWPHGHEAGFVHCVVVGRDERAVTAVPLRRTDDRLLSRLAPGDKVKARFWRDGDTEYRFRTQILEVVEETTTIRLCHAERLERVQLRDYYRIGVNEPIQLYVLPPGVEQVKADNVAAKALELRDATLVDLSGGGLAVQVKSELPRHSEVVVHPDYAGPFPLAGAQLVQIEQTRRDRHWRARLQFVSLPDSVRDDLVAAIFEHEASSSH